MNKTEKLSHVGRDGRARMVDVSQKKTTVRTAKAQATVVLGKTICKVLKDTGSIKKGNVTETARIAGIMAAKRTSELIPMCHPLSMDVVDIETELTDTRIIITASVKCKEATGVEMEAMTAVGIAALTVYDMCKSVSKGITIEKICLLSKTGGKSGNWSKQEGIRSATC